MAGETIQSIAMENMQEYGKRSTPVKSNHARPEPVERWHSVKKKDSGPSISQTISLMWWSRWRTQMKTLIIINAITNFVIILWLWSLSNKIGHLRINLERTFWKNIPIGINFWWIQGCSGYRLLYVPFWKKEWVNDKPRKYHEEKSMDGGKDV